MTYDRAQLDRLEAALAAVKKAGNPVIEESLKEAIRNLKQS
jgi:hypothetical protein